MREKSIPRTVAVMTAITFAGKAMGVFRDILQGRLLGADTVAGVAFMQASVLPRHFFDILFASVFSASFIPVFNQYLETRGRQAAFDLAARFITVVLALTAAVTVLCVVFTGPLYRLALGGAADPQTQALGIRLLRLMFPLMTLSGLAFALTGVLQSLGEFRVPAAMSAASNGVVLAYYALFFDRFGVYGLCAAFLLGWGMQAAIQIPFLMKNGFGFRPRFAPRDPGLRQIAGLALPVMAASWAGPVNLLVNGKAVSVFGGAYDYTAVNFAYSLFSVISGVLALSVANVLFPALSRQAAARDTQGFQDAVTDALRGLLFFLLPMTFGLMAVSTPLVRLLFGGGLFDETAVTVTGAGLFYFSMGMAGFGAQLVLSRACYARRDGRTPLWAAFAAIALNAALSCLLAPRMAHAAGGAALASSVAVTGGAVLMLAVCVKKGYARFPRAWLWDVARMLLLALGMWAAVGAAARRLPVGLVVLLGAVLYLGGAYAWGLREARAVKKFLPRGRKRGRGGNGKES